MISIFVTDDTLCALPGPVTPHYIQATMTAFPTWRNEVTLRSLEHGLTFEPAAWVPFVSPTPLLMLVGASDVCTFPDIQLDVFQSANEPKRVLVHPGGHFDTYVKHFEATSGAAVDWFAQHLTVL